MVPQLREGVALIPVDDEGVIYDADTGNLHRLDVVAMRVCGLFDGHRRLDQIVDTLEEQFEAPSSVIAADVAALVTALEAKGVLAAGSTNDSQTVDAPPGEGLKDDARYIGVPPST